MIQDFGINGILDTDKLINLANWKLKLRNQAKEDGKYDFAEYYERQMKIYDKAADYIALNAMMSTKELLAIPEINTSIGILALPMNSESFNADLKEAEEVNIIEHVIGNEEAKQIIRGKLNSPIVKKQVQEFKDNISLISEKLQIEGFDLFALNKQRELKLRLKLKRQQVLNAEEEKQLFAKEVRETVLNMLQSGARSDAIDMLKRYVFRHQNYSDAETHKLLDSLKDKFKIKEPKTNPNIKALYIGNFENQWLKISYKTGNKIVGNIKKDITESIIGLFNPERNGIIGVDGKVICKIESVIKFITVTPNEQEQINKIIENI